ncbi:MAG: tetratricopeptide repeat protein [Candidatus Glassbacteria bacterium]|nr:tetratricopeptide repeat protein [Candidatus Glassbacteria bacterium]
MTDIKQDRNRRLSAALIFLVVAIASFCCMQYPGPSNEEVTQYEALLRQREWRSRFSTDNFEPFSAENIQHYWSGYQRSDQRVIETSGPFLRTAYGLIQPLGKLFTGDFEAFRSGSALAFALLSALLFLWLAPVLGTLGALAAAVVFVLTPRAFAAGIQATHYPWLACLWFFSAWLFEREPLSRTRVLLFALAMGVGMAVSVSFLLLLLCLAVWMLISGRTGYRGKMLAAGLAAMIFLPPLLNPLWWHAPLSGYARYLAAGLIGHKGYGVPVLYFGKLYQSGLPWHYVIVMLAATIPIASLALVLAGKVISLKPKMFAGPVGLALTTSTAFILVGLTGRFPASDGMAYFLPVYAADAMMAGAGFAWLLGRLQARLPGLAKPAGILVLLLIAVPPLVWQIRLFPCMSSHYNAITGFLKGASKAGLEVCFDGSVIDRSFLEKLNEKVPGESRVKVVGAPLYFLDSRKRVREDIYFHQQLYDHVAIMNRPGTFIDQDCLLFTQAEPYLKAERCGVLFAGIYDQKKEYKRLYRLYEQRMFSDKASPEDCYYMGVLLKAAHMFDQAVPLFHRAVRMDSTMSGAWYSLGYIDYYSEKADSAAGYLTRAVELDPDNAEYLALAAEVQEKLGNLEEALGYAEQAVAVEPFNSDYNSRRGDLLIKLSRPAESRKYLERAILTDTLDLQSMHLIGLSYRQEKNFSLAEAAYQRIMKITERNHVYLGQMGEMYREMGDYERCADMYEKILALRYNNPPILHLLGDLYLNQLDQPEKALKCYQDCLRFNPRYRGRGQVDKAIRKIEKRLGKKEG